MSFLQSQIVVVNILIYFMYIIMYKYSNNIMISQFGIICGSAITQSLYICTCQLIEKIHFTNIKI